MARGGPGVAWRWREYVDRSARQSPARLALGVFGLVIGTITLGLSAPWATATGERAPFVDALFTAASASRMVRSSRSDVMGCPWPKSYASISRDQTTRTGADDVMGSPSHPGPPLSIRRHAPVGSIHTPAACQSCPDRRAPGRLREV